MLSTSNVQFISENNSNCFGQYTIKVKSVWLIYYENNKTNYIFYDHYLNVINSVDN